MTCKVLARFVLPCLVSVVAAERLAAQQVIRLGGEFQINSYTPFFQFEPNIALDADGDFVVVYVGAGQDGSDNGVFARRFTSSGVAVGIDFQVNTYTSGAQNYPSVARDADGDFVIVWQSYGQDGSGDGIFARRFNAAGVPQAAEFGVNAYITYSQSHAAVALDDDGDFVVAWSAIDGDGYDSAVFARRFNSAGAAQGIEFQVNSYTSDDQYYPTVARDGDGDFVVAWNSYEQDGRYSGIFAQRFSSTGVAQAIEFQVNAITAGYQFRPVVDLDADGDFVVTWANRALGSNYPDIFARRFDAGGVARGVDFQVNTYTPSSQYDSAVAVDHDGDFVVAWRSNLQDGFTFGIFARSFSSTGIAQTAEFQVNSFTPGDETTSDLAIDADGDFVVVWASAFDQDGSNDGIFAQRFATSRCSTSTATARPPSSATVCSCCATCSASPAPP